MKISFLYLKLSYSFFDSDCFINLLSNTSGGLGINIYIYSFEFPEFEKLHIITKSKATEGYHLLFPWSLWTLAKYCFECCKTFIAAFNFSWLNIALIVFIANITIRSVSLQLSATIVYDLFMISLINANAYITDIAFWKYYLGFINNFSLKVLCRDNRDRNMFCF